MQFKQPGIMLNNPPHEAIAAADKLLRQSEEGVRCFPSRKRDGLGQRLIPVALSLNDFPLLQRCMGMKPACRCLAVLAFFLLAAAGHADEAAKVRPTIERSLRFLTKAGDEWVAEQNCIACHHMALLIDSHTEALRRGFKVDSRKLDEWTDWCLLGLDKSQGGVEVYAEMALAVPAAAPQLRKLILAKQQKDGMWKFGRSV